MKRAAKSVSQFILDFASPKVRGTKRFAKPKCSRYSRNTDCETSLEEVRKTKKFAKPWSLQTSKFAKPPYSPSTTQHHLLWQTYPPSMTHTYPWGKLLRQTHSPPWEINLPFVTHIAFYGTRPPTAHIPLASQISVFHDTPSRLNGTKINSQPPR